MVNHGEASVPCTLMPRAIIVSHVTPEQHLRPCTQCLSPDSLYLLVSYYEYCQPENDFVPINGSRNLNKKFLVQNISRPVWIFHFSACFDSPKIVMFEWHLTKYS